MKEITCYTYGTFFPGVPAQEVFTYLHYDKHVFNWNNQVIENRYETTEDEVSEGSNYISRMRIDKKEIEVEIFIKKMDIPSHFIAESRTKEGINVTQYLLDERADGTQFRVLVSIIPANIFYSLLAQTTKWAVKYVYNDVFDQFKDYVEAQSKAHVIA